MRTVDNNKLVLCVFMSNSFVEAYFLLSIINNNLVTLAGSVEYNSIVTTTHSIYFMNKTLIVYV